MEIVQRIGGGAISYHFSAKVMNNFIFTLRCFKDYCAATGKREKNFNLHYCSPALSARTECARWMGAHKLRQKMIFVAFLFFRNVGRRALSMFQFLFKPVIWANQQTQNEDAVLRMWRPIWGNKTGCTNNDRLSPQININKFMYKRGGVEKPI